MAIHASFTKNMLYFAYPFSLHSEVTVAGVLNFVEKFEASIALGVSISTDFVLADFRTKYLRELQKRSSGSPFTTDKMPNNFRFIGLICSAFSEAKIIHVKRDPSATCWSNYKQYFPAKGFGYCYDLNYLVAYHSLYKDLMQIWQEQHDGRIYHLNYDILTINQSRRRNQKVNTIFGNSMARFLPFTTR